MDVLCHLVIQHLPSWHAFDAANSIPAQVRNIKLIQICPTERRVGRADQFFCVGILEENVHLQIGSNPVKDLHQACHDQKIAILHERHAIWNAIQVSAIDTDVAQLAVWLDLQP